MARISSLNLRYSKVREEERLEISMIKIMIREVIKMEIDQIVEIGKYCSLVEYNMERIIEIDLGTIRITEVTLEEVIVEEICDLQIRFIEDEIIEVDTEVIIEMIIMMEVAGGQETDNTQTIPAGMTEVVVGLDQVKELVQIETELDAIHVENMIILLRITQLQL